MRTLSTYRKIDGYEQLSKLFASIEHQPAETWKPSTYCQAQAIGLRYGIEIEEIERLYGFKTQPSKPPPAAPPISVKVSEAKPIKVVAEPNQKVECKVCGKTFEQTRADKLYCSHTCGSRLRNLNRRLKLKNSK